MDLAPFASRSRQTRRRRITVIAGVALAAVLAGCGANGNSATQPSPAPTNGSSPTSTTSGSGTQSTTTTTQLPGVGKPVVTIGDKNYGEQFVLGELYLIALRYQGFKVNITQNIGPESSIRGALKNNSLAMYPEYLNIFDGSLAHTRRRFTTLAAALRAGRRWADRNGLTLLTPTPFSDTAGVAVTDAYATEYRLSTLVDLGRLPTTLYIGGAIQFETARAGLPGLESTYDVLSPDFVALAVGDQYAALNAGKVQAAYVDTTDGQLATGDYRVLADPKHIFGFGNVVPVMTDTASQEEGPAFAATIERVDATLTLSTMRALNNAVSVANQSPSTVALAYLQTHGLLQPLPLSDYQ